MLNKISKFLMLGFVVLMLGTWSVRAYPFLEVESAYEGDGWFRYTLRLPIDYFSPGAEINAFGIQEFGTVQEMEVPSGWTAFTVDQAGWQPQSKVTRPTQIVFRCRSSYQNYKRQSAACLVPISFYDEGLGMVINGAVWCDGLVPCPPGEADGSDAVLTTKVETNPDLKITKLYLNQGKVSGILFNWQVSAGYVLEASSDLKEWHDAVAFNTGTGSASFTPIDDPGPFFRLRLNEYYAPSAPQSVQLSSGSAVENGDVISNVEFTAKGDDLLAVFPSKPGESYTVGFLSMSQTLSREIKVVATAAQTAVSIPAIFQKQPVLLRVTGSSPAK